MEHPASLEDHGALHTPTIDSEPRRSSRLASRSNIQNTKESKMEDKKKNTLAEQSRNKPKVVLYHNAPKSKHKSHRATTQQGSMADLSGERPRKARRMNDKSNSRRSSGPAVPLEDNVSEPSTAPSGTVSKFSEPSVPVITRDNRSGNTVPPLDLGPPSGQPKSSSRRKSSNNKSITENKSHRVSGMPSAIPRSDTPPPQFDITNPYSALSDQPAPAKRRPSTSSEPTANPPSITPPSSDALHTSRLRESGKGENSSAAAEANDGDPSWHHPWGIPVEPLPPAPPRYIPPHERAKIAVDFDSSQAGEEFYGLDEHVLLGDHLLDLEFANYLIENQQRENEFSGSSNSILASRNTARFINNPADYNERQRLPGPLPVTPNTVDLPVAGNGTAFPHYPYVFNQNSLEPASLGAQSRPVVPLALRILRENAQKLANGGGDEEDIRRSSLAESIMSSLVSEQAKTDMPRKRGDTQAPVGQQSEQAPQPQPQQPQQTHQGNQSRDNSNTSQRDLKDLALAKLKAGKTSPTGEPTCTFCRYECDWGISNDNFLLDADASTGSCQECSNPNVGSFFNEFTSILQSRDDEASRAALEQINQPVHSESTHQHRPRVYSSIDGNEITRFMGPMFCKSCPWGQIDIEKVRICSTHRNEKYAIIKHHRHQKFRQIGYAMPDDLLQADRIRDMNMNDAEDRLLADVIKGRELDANYCKNKRCMVCTGLATDVCADCPLRICSTCSTFLRNICKGYLNNLFYHYERHHIRNDAFLLRSDGGGF